jgi:hypothetical protein
MVIMTVEAGIYRNELPTDGKFTTVANDWIRNTGLSPQANMLWIYLLSHKVGYELRDGQILRETGFGRKGLRAARSELVENGWLVLERMKNADGSLGTYAYHLRTARDPQGTVAKGTVEQGTVAEGSDLRRPITKEKTNNKKTISKAKPKNADDYEPSSAIVEPFETDYPGLRLDVELEKFRNHHMAKGSIFKDWDRAFRNWLSRASEWSKEARAERARLDSDAEWEKYKRENGLD